MVRLHMIGITEEGDIELIGAITSLYKMLPHITLKKSVLYSRMKNYSSRNPDVLVTYPAAAQYAGRYDRISVLKVGQTVATGGGNVVHQTIFDRLDNNERLIYTAGDALDAPVGEDLVEYELAEFDMEGNQRISITTNTHTRSITQKASFVNIHDPRVIIPVPLMADVDYEPMERGVERIYTPEDMAAFIYGFYVRNRLTIRQAHYFYIVLRLDVPVEQIMGTDSPTERERKMDDYTTEFRTVHLKERVIQLEDKSFHDRGLNLVDYETFLEQFLEYFKSVDEASSDLISGSDNWLMRHGAQVNTGQFQLVVSYQDPTLADLVIGFTDDDDEQLIRLNRAIEDYVVDDPHNRPEKRKGKDCVLSCVMSVTRYNRSITAHLMGVKARAVARVGMEPTAELFEMIEEVIKRPLLVFEWKDEVLIRLYDSQSTLSGVAVNFLVADGHCYVMYPNRQEQLFVTKAVESGTSKRLYVSFDIETVSNFTKYTVDPVMISSFRLETDYGGPNLDECPEPWYLTERNAKEGVLTTYTGKDCIRQWFSDLRAVVGAYSDVIVYSYNGAKFDNWIVLKEIADDYDYIGSMLYYDNALFFKVGGLTFRDVFKYGSPGPLSAKTAANKLYKKIDVGGASFNLQNRRYNELGCDMDAYIEWMKAENYWDDYIMYCEYDVKSLAEYTLRLRSGFLLMFGVDMFDSYTLGAMSLKIFKERTGCVPFKLTGEEYKRLLKAQYAGISYSRGYDKVVENALLVVVDLVSQYPTALLNYSFPVGGLRLVDVAKAEMMLSEGKLGIFEVENVDQSALTSICVIPHRTKDGYDYISRDKVIASATITTADYETLLEHGGVCDVVKSYMFYDAQPGHELFGDYVIPPAQDKTKQDIVRAAGRGDEAAQALVTKYGLEDVVYDEQVRETSKLVLNIITGKMSQKFRETNYVMTSSRYGYTKAVEDDDMTFVADASSKTQIFKQRKRIEDQETIGSYIPFALFIYSYARRMLHEVLQPHALQPLLMETDSLTITMDEMNLFKHRSKRLFNVMTKQFEDVPLLHGEILDAERVDEKMFGQYELEDGQVYTRGISIAKKSYLLEDERSGMTKYKFKGISKRSVLVDDESIVTLYRQWQDCKKDVLRTVLNTELYMRINDYLDSEHETPFSFDCYRAILEQHEVSADFDRRIQASQIPDVRRELKKEKAATFILIAYSGFHKKTKGSKFMIEPSIGLKKL